MAKYHSLNLLGSEKKQFIDVFFSWALTAGRFIVILTETIALLTFLYRFGLDRNIIDLHDKIKTNETFVQALQNNENLYRNLQFRIKTAKTLGAANALPLTHFNDMITLAKGSLIFDSLTISDTSIRMTGVISSPQGLKLFIEKLQGYPDIKTVSVDNIENKSSNATIAVTITATLKKHD